MKGNANNQKSGGSHVVHIEQDSNEDVIIYPSLGEVILTWSDDDEIEYISPNDKGIQTDFPMTESSGINMFFCTFHSKKDAETYCCLPTTSDETDFSSKPKVMIEYQEDKNKGYHINPGMFLLVN